MSKPAPAQTVSISPPRSVEKPWGGELIFAHTERYVGKILRIESGHSLSRQYHEVKDETIYVMEGTLILEIGAAPEIQVNKVATGEGFRVRPGVIHRFRADARVVLLEVSTPELGDVVRLEDNYGREGTCAP